jgi:hypothetical protein
MQQVGFITCKHDKGEEYVLLCEVLLYDTSLLAL